MRMRQVSCALGLAVAATFALQAAPAMANSGDIGVALSAPAKVEVGQKVAYEFTVSNAGPEGIEPEFRFTKGHGATNTLQGSSLHTISQSNSSATGGCNNDGKGVICRFGNMLPGESATVTVVVEVFDRDRPKLNLQATVGPEHPEGNTDPNQANNHLDITTKIADPITVDGLPHGCLSHTTKVGIEIAVAHATKAKALVDGKVVDTTKGSKLKVKLAAGQLSHGGHKLSVVVQGHKGPPLAELERKFKRC